MKVDTYVEDLLASLQRAYEIFYNPVIQTLEDGYLIYFQAREVIPVKMRPMVRHFMRWHTKEAGWMLKDLVFEKRFLSFGLMPREQRRACRRTHP